LTSASPSERCSVPRFLFELQGNAIKIDGAIEREDRARVDGGFLRVSRRAPRLSRGEKVAHELLGIARAAGFERVGEAKVVEPARPFR
jgi:hypothetical protein